MANRLNIKIEPMNVTWGEDIAQVEKITTRADVSSDLNNDYFWLTEAGGTRHYFWYNVASGGTDPAPGGTGNVIAISANATASAVATATQLVIHALSGFNATVSGNVITVTHVANGYAVPGRDGVGTNFAFEIVTQGNTAQDVGYIDGNVEFTHEEQLVDVTAHQEGTDVLSHIRTGISPEITLTLKETQVGQLKRLFSYPGGSFIPAGASATELSGSGTLKKFRQTFEDSAKLLLHPRVLDAADKSRDFTFWKAYPQLDSLNFSGEEIQVIPITFMLYPDLTKPKPIQFFAIGDSTQTLV